MKTNNNDTVTILLATYNPNTIWFNQLLISLNNQNYPHLFLIVIDDKSDDEKYEQIIQSLKKYITSFKYLIKRNEKNVGSNITFERLINNAKSEYIAFCDQDDIWNIDKISSELEFMVSKNKEMVCSDVQIIDEHDKLLCTSMCKYRKRFNLDPTNYEEYLIYKNFCIGCTILMKRSLALTALPFSNIMVHDHELAINAAHKGALCVYKNQTLKYRIHKDNQTSVLKNVTNKQTYYINNIHKFSLWVNYLMNLYPSQYLQNAKLWSVAREDNYHKIPGSRKRLKQYGNKNKKTTSFEVYILHHPLLMKLVLKLLKNNLL